MSIRSPFPDTFTLVKTVRTGLNPQMFFLVFLTVSLSFHSAFSQSTFQRTYGKDTVDYCRSVRQTNDDGYIMVGVTERVIDGVFEDTYLIKTDENGDTLWIKALGGDLPENGSYSVQQTNDNGYIITGVTYGYWGPMDHFDISLIKTNENGDTLWTKSYGGTDDEYGYSIEQTIDGGYIICGITNSFGAGNRDVYLIKTDWNGDTLWTRTYGGADSDFGLVVQPTTDLGYIIVGHTKSFGAGNYDIYLIKTDIIGDIQWTKTYGGTEYENGSSVQQTSDGGYIIAGSTYSFGAGNGDVYIIKTDENGDTLWTRTYGGSNTDGGKSIEQTNDGGYIIAAGTSSFGAGSKDVYLIKTDKNGDTLWTKTYGSIGYESCESIQQTRDGGYIIGGHTTSFGARAYDFYLIKTDTEGNTGSCNEYRTNTVVKRTNTNIKTPTTLVSRGGSAHPTALKIFNSPTRDSVLCLEPAGFSDTNNFHDANNLRIYPNPNTGKFTIEMDVLEIQDLQITITNVLGQRICFDKVEKFMGTYKKKLDFNKYSKGIYHLQIKSVKGEINRQVICQ
ncbi:MAG: T9SS type A sorting domain-containing protein [Bacteroidia bacterium]|nr:T9SS type A sorting domain-containing protein [Bacteroidia bacterium]